MTDRTDSCPSCGGDRFDERPALVAPFIAHYVLDRAPEPTAVRDCSGCGLVFFATRYTDDEIARLYKDYRGEGYLRTRHSFEPWYTARFNEDIGGPAGMEPRKRVYRAIVEPYAARELIDSVLDYAGDRGQMMEGGPGRRHFVYEISGVRPVDGVTAISEPGALEGREFDLVLLCGVVEHFSAPLEAVRQVARHVRPGGLLYVEVPGERFDIRRIPRGNWYKTYLAWLARTPLLLRLVDFWSTGMRVKLGVLPPLGFVKQHEHLNFFTAGSLSHLVRAAGLEAETCEVRGGAVVALCRRPAT